MADTKADYSNESNFVVIGAPPPAWGRSLEMLCRGLGAELRWTQFGRNGGYIGETDEELARRTQQRLFEWPRDSFRLTSPLGRRLFNREERRCCGEQFGWVPMPTGRLTVAWDGGEQQIPIESISPEQSSEQLIVDLMGWPHGPGPLDRKEWCERYLALWEAYK